MISLLTYEDIQSLMEEMTIIKADLIKTQKQLNELIEELKKKKI